MDKEMLVERMRKVWRLGWWRDARNRSEDGRGAVIGYKYTLDWFEGGAVNRNRLKQETLGGVV